MISNELELMEYSEILVQTPKHVSSICKKYGSNNTKKSTLADSLVVAFKLFNQIQIIPQN